MQNEEIIAGLQQIVAGSGTKKLNQQAAEHAIAFIGALTEENTRIIAEHPEYAQLKEDYAKAFENFKENAVGDPEIQQKLEAMEEANKELMLELDAAKKAQGKNQPHISSGDKVYRSLAKKWLDRVVKDNGGTGKFVTIEDCQQNAEMLQRAINFGMVVEITEGGEA